MTHNRTLIGGAFKTATLSFGLAALVACSGSSQETAPESQPASTPTSTTSAMPTQSELTIGQIQGSGETSPMAGEKVTVSGIITADMRAQYQGVFIQSSPDQSDADPVTSDALFVYLPGGTDQEIATGDDITVTATVGEFKGQTQLSDVTEITVNSKSDPVAVPVILPLADGLSWESYENMYVTFPKPMVVSETYNLGRYGQVVLSQDERMIQPTQHLAPGAPSSAEAQAQAALSLLLEDGSDAQNPSPTPFLINGKTLRSGDSVNGLTGVIQYRFDSFQLVSPEPIQFENTNPRTIEPPEVGGNVKVASFNVLNLFNGDGTGAGFPTSRGANTHVEFDRQFAKIINAIHALDADIVGLMEIENDGFEETSALIQLVNALNEKSESPEDNYDFVQPSESMGTDEIKVAMIYRPMVVELVGEPALITDGPLANRRPSLVATFNHTSGDALTVVVNHLKSKGCRGSSGENADQNDGQGCYNAERVEAAQAIINALKSNPTGVEEADILVIGDMNSYSNEDPITEFTQNGYRDALSDLHGAENIYTYVFSGNAGVLDHAIVSDSLSPKVAGASPWNINADEPRILDYNMEFNPQELYDESPFRSSDHDPVLIGLNLGS